MKDKDTVQTSKVIAAISAEGAELTVRLNGNAIEGESGKYSLKFNIGDNQLNVRAVSKSGAVSQLIWTIKYSPLNYQKTIDQKIKALSQWAKRTITADRPEQRITFRRNQEKWSQPVMQ